MGTEIKGLLETYHLTNKWLIRAIRIKYKVFIDSNDMSRFMVGKLKPDDEGRIYRMALSVLLRYGELEIRLLEEE